MTAQTKPTEFERPQADLRGGTRSSAFLLAFIETDGGAWPVCLRNISTTGALIESEAGFVLGSKVVFRRAFAAVPAEIVWRRSGRFGLTFDSELAEEEVSALARRITGRWSTTPTG
jgi:hypothetical protein